MKRVRDGTDFFAGQKRRELGPAVFLLVPTTQCKVHLSRIIGLPGHNYSNGDILHLIMKGLDYMVGKELLI